MGSAVDSSLGNPGWSRSTPLLAGDAGTAQTIHLIRKAIWDGLSDARVRAQLAQILRGIPAYDTAAEAKAIYSWVLYNIRFTNDPVGHETVSTAHWTMSHGIGDCDDINGVLLPTLLMSAGIPVRLITISNDPSDPSRFSHIYAEAEINGQWIPMDAARPGARFGNTTQRYHRKRVWSLVDRKYQDVAGLSGCHGRCRRGMGFDWNVFSDVFSKAGKTASNILQSISRVTIPGSSPPPGTYPGQVTTPGISTGTLLLLGGLGLGAMALLQRK